MPITRPMALAAVVITISALSIALPVQAQSMGTILPPACASAEQAASVREYYDNKRPGVPLAVASRFFKVSEFTIASALPDDQSLGTLGSAKVTDAVWSSIDAWGATTRVKLVLSPDSQHAFAFPSLVPITQDDSSDGYLDVYADEGRGVHSHIQLAKVAAIYATDIPSDKSGFRTRAISLFGHSGNLILGIYASLKNEEPDTKAVEGFSKTWDLIKSMPRLCHS